MTPSGRLTNEELIEVSKITGIPLIYIMKMDTYNFIDRRSMMFAVLNRAYNDIKKRTGDSDQDIEKGLHMHFNVPINWAVECHRNK